MLAPPLALGSWSVGCICEALVVNRWDSVHADALADGMDWYFDPDTRLLVLTEISLLARGHCCNSGCRHCPYPLTDTESDGPEPSGEVRH
jgi:hypothetical protein